MTGAERTYSVDCDVQTAFRAALVALAKEGFEIVEDDPSAGQIRARKGTSVWSWGELMRISIESKDQLSMVSVASSSRAQIVDWGTNEVNVERVGRRLKKEVQDLRVGAADKR